MNDFCAALVKAGKEILSYEDSPDPGWFEFNKEELLLLINKRNKLLHEARLSPNPSSLLKQKCIDARNNVYDAIKMAKSRWVSSLAGRMDNMNKSPKDAWRAINTLKQGFTAHHTNHTPIKFNKEDGALTSTDRENIILLSQHFHGVCNRETSIDWYFVNTIPH